MDIVPETSLTAENHVMMKRMHVKTHANLAQKIVKDSYSLRLAGLLPGQVIVHFRWIRQWLVLMFRSVQF